MTTSSFITGSFFSPNPASHLPLIQPEEAPSSRFRRYSVAGKHSNFDLPSRIRPHFRAYSRLHQPLMSDFQAVQEHLCSATFYSIRHTDTTKYPMGACLLQRNCITRLSTIRRPLGSFPAKRISSITTTIAFISRPIRINRR